MCKYNEKLKQYLNCRKCDDVENKICAFLFQCSKKDLDDWFWGRIRLEDILIPM